MNLPIISSKKKAYIITFLLGLFILFSAPVDADFGWHIRYGQDISQEHSLPHSNEYSFTFEDYNWADSYWLSQVIIYKTQEYLGVTGMSLVFSTVLVVFLFLYLKFFEEKDDYVKNLPIPLLITFLSIEHSRASIRPIFFSSLAIIILSLILNKKHKLISYLPILFVLWANLHADFILGLAIFTLYLANTLIKDKRVKLEVLLSYVLSVIATLVNPYGLLLHETLLKESHPFQFMYIQEWRPLWEIDIKLAIYVLIFAIFIVFRWEKLSNFIKVLFLLFFVLSFRFGYFSRIFILLTLPSFVESFNYYYNSLNKYMPSIKQKILSIALKIAIFLLMFLYSLTFFRKVENSNSTRKWSASYGYPYEATQYIKQNQLEGNIYNSYSWGGYLIWQLPENKVFIDGRMPSWRVENRSVFEDYINIQKDPEANRVLIKTYIDQYDIKLAILQRDSLTIKILKDMGWEIVYVDEKAVVLKAPEIYYQMAQLPN